ncbi:hypothetical protein SUDANB178_06437 [Streptomyces sp. enrichment culture]
MLSRLLEAHEVVLAEAHDAAARTAELGDDGTNDLLVSQAIRTGELQAWFVAESGRHAFGPCPGLSDDLLTAF